MREASEKVGLNINKTKTAAMTVRGEGDTVIDSEEIHEVSRVKFLGSHLTPDGDSCKDIKGRIGMAKAVAVSMTEAWNSWKSRDLSRRLKVRLAKPLRHVCVLLLCSVIMYRSMDCPILLANDKVRCV